MSNIDRLSNACTRKELIIRTSTKSRDYFNPPYDMFGHRRAFRARPGPNAAGDGTFYAAGGRRSPAEGRPSRRRRTSAPAPRPDRQGCSRPAPWPADAKSFPASRPALSLRGAAARHRCPALCSGTGRLEEESGSGPEMSSQGPKTGAVLSVPACRAARWHGPGLPGAVGGTGRHREERRRRRPPECRSTETASGPAGTLLPDCLPVWRRRLGSALPQARSPGPEKGRQEIAGRGPGRRRAHVSAAKRAAATRAASSPRGREAKSRNAPISTDSSSSAVKRKALPRRREMPRRVSLPAVRRTMRPARESRFNWRAGSVGRRCRGARSRSPAPSLCRRCKRRSTTVLRKRRSPRDTWEFRFGSIRACTARS